MFKRELIKDNSIVVRCYARRDGDQWVAVCVDLCLAAQADTCDEARQRLHLQVKDFVQDILESGKANPVTRPAPLSQWITYWRIKAHEDHIRPLKNAGAVAAAVFRDSLNVDRLQTA